MQHNYKLAAASIHTGENKRAVEYYIFYGSTIYNIKKSTKGEKNSMIDQDILRKEVKLAKACNDWLYYKDLADTLELHEHSFYNWLNQEYKLSEAKARKLEDIVIDLIDEDIKY